MSDDEAFAKRMRQRRGLPPEPKHKGRSFYWDEHGAPLKQHVPCPRCHERNEVGSYYDAAWCAACGWQGSLIEMHVEAQLSAG